MKLINKLTLEFPSKSINESLARTAAACFASQLDPTLEELGDIKTAVSEAVTNAIVHAYPESIGQVYLKAEIYDNNTLKIIVRDKGCGIFDINAAMKPMFTTGNEERAGMGFTIMDSFMDHLDVKSQPGKGTAVTMKKKISVRFGKIQ